MHNPEPEGITEPQNEYPYMLTCEYCGKTSEDVELCEDPFMSEIRGYHEKYYRWERHA